VVLQGPTSSNNKTIFGKRFKGKHYTIPYIAPYILKIGCSRSALSKTFFYLIHAFPRPSGIGLPSQASFDAQFHCKKNDEQAVNLYYVINGRQIAFSVRKAGAKMACDKILCRTIKGKQI